MILRHRGRHAERIRAVDPNARSEPYPSERDRARDTGTSGGYREGGNARPYRDPRESDPYRDPRERAAYQERGQYRDASAYDADRGQSNRGWAELAAGDDEVSWRARTRVVLSPMAAPSIIGLYGFMGATLMVGAWQAGWYGSSSTGEVLWPFAIFFGGLAQLVAGFYALRARDTVAVAAHGTWGAFWLGWGVLQLLIATGVTPAIAFGSTNTPFAFWFIVLTLITMMAAIGALGRNLGVAAVLWTLAAGSALTAAGFYAGSLGTQRAGGVLFVISAALAWLVASAMVFEGAFRRTIIPLGEYSKAGNIPGRVSTVPMEYRGGEPGVKVGQ